MTPKFQVKKQTRKQVTVKIDKHFSLTSIFRSFRINFLLFFSENIWLYNLADAAIA